MRKSTDAMYLRFSEHYQLMLPRLLEHTPFLSPKTAELVTAHLKLVNTFSALLASQPKAQDAPLFKQFFDDLNASFGTIQAAMGTEVNTAPF
jgi:hypothetical protein